MNDEAIKYTTKEYIVTSDYDKLSVQEFLFSAHSFSRRIITRLKQNRGDILLNGEHVRMIDPVSTGDTITIKLQEQSYCNTNDDLSVPIVYEDDDVIVFNKPVNMPVHPSRNHQNDTLANFFTSYMLKKGLHLQFRPINRLDRDTCGLCVVAKNALAAKLLSNSVKKEYTAIVCGVIPHSHGTINAPIVRLDDFYIKRGVYEGNMDNIPQDISPLSTVPAPQHAVTHYTVVLRSERYTKVNVILETGRTHQIRVHFSHIGYPLAGDDMYGGDTTHTSFHMLCCSKISFTSPQTKDVVTLSC
ncbi:MAG: RluA family pseudouridine synthase, partial [Niameybacter sp.]